MRYAFYLGCLIPEREPSYEMSVRKIAPELGIELVDMKGANCCAPFGIQSVDYMSWLALAARNLAIAEGMGLDILTLCNDCYESLLTANTILKEDAGKRTEVNKILADVDLEFKGKIDVKTFSDVLYENVSLEKVRSIIKEPFKSLRAAVQPGCHLSRPKRIHFSKGKETSSLDALVEATGAKSIPYDEKESCCGGPLRGIDDNVAMTIAKQKLDSIKASGANCIVTVCPFCYLELDMGQLEVSKHFKEEYNIPVFNFAELLRVSMGSKLEEWEIKAHRVPITKILDIKGGRE